MKLFVKKYALTLLLFLAFFTGLGLLAYPSFSNWWHVSMATHALGRYVSQVQNMEDEAQQEILDQAYAYNEALLDTPTRFIISAQDEEAYQSLLNIGQDGMMASLYIPSLQLNLPIYHGTSEAVLQKGIGHLQGSSLPVGGAGTHCILCGHRGLPSAKLFTDLNQLVIGDTFEITTLNQSLLYEVDQIQIVLPSQADVLEIDPEQDYVTLLTCTPYGVNSHRLLVRGHRIENKEELNILQEAGLYDSRIVAPILSIPLVLILIFCLAVPKIKKTPHSRSKKKHF